MPEVINDNDSQRRETMKAITFPEAFKRLEKINDEITLLQAKRDGFICEVLENKGIDYPMFEKLYSEWQEKEVSV